MSIWPAVSMLLNLQHWQTNWSRALHIYRNWNWVTTSKPRNFLPKTAAQGFSFVGLCCSAIHWMSTSFHLFHPNLLFFFFFPSTAFSERHLPGFIIKMMAKISLSEISFQKQCCCQTLQTNYVVKCLTLKYNGHGLTESTILSLVLNRARTILNRKMEGSNSFGLSLHDQTFQESLRDPHPVKRHVQ